MRGRGAAGERARLPHSEAQAAQAQAVRFMFAKVRAADACVLILNVQNKVDEHGLVPTAPARLLQCKSCNCPHALSQLPTCTCENETKPMKRPFSMVSSEPIADGGVGG